MSTNTVLGPPGSLASIDFDAAALAAENTSEAAVSWGAIIAGAAAAAALSLVLLILGTGLGLSSVSPWSGSGVQAKTLGLSAILWITATQILASGMGGYIAGRLRHKWSGVAGDEVYFRDTAHGFLAWAVSSLVTAAFLASAIGSIVSSGAQATAGAAKTIVQGASAAGGMAGAIAGGPIDLGYAVDSLFRKAAGTGTTEQSSTAQVAESSRIFVSALAAGSMDPEDLRYVAQMVVQRTGLAQNEAELRVGGAFQRIQTNLKNADQSAREAADTTRKASAYSALWLFVSLLIGAFTASFMATLGGRQLRN